VHVESVHFSVVDGDRKLRRKSSKKLIHNSEIVSDIFVADHLVILGGADGEESLLWSLKKLQSFQKLQSFSQMMHN
jgi:hypothetical protein